ncbi:MAG: sigma-54-dependent Fis family transcriptional regulator [Deltaproteobacteria bacterium]|nr:sigma-54-dependent Fis family transcriptional regulator [Deltaproteobacteria bacterium]
MHTILIVDDEPNYLIVISELLGEEGFETITADNGSTALELAQKSDIDLLLTDMQMPGMDGFSLLEKIKFTKPNLPVIMITAYGEVEKAVRAMRQGAFSYITKPFNNDELVATIKKALEHRTLAKENIRLRNEARSRYGFDRIIGKSRVMQRIYNLIERVAPTPTTVLISGESGTGKELVAHALHYNSPRSTGPFLSLNCAALPESLLESELFGHERGAFTGAIAMRKGKFEAADTGTIFLDEIGEMPLSLQAKFLRVLQEKSIERVGGNKTIEVDVRIVAATNKNLADEVKNGNFREDLFYRLNVVSIHIPPLRDRIDDIPILANHFIKKHAAQIERPNLIISREALSLLARQTWPGNVRELENTIERAAIFCNRDEITAHDINAAPHDAATANASTTLSPPAMPAGKLPEVLDTIEKQMLIEALKENDFVQTRAAKKLGITKSLLQYKLRKYKIMVK